jgi:hypothetical protein
MATTRFTKFAAAAAATATLGLAGLAAASTASADPYTGGGVVGPHGGTVHVQGPHSGHASVNWR